jgi:hypothetical protein
MEIGIDRTNSGDARSGEKSASITYTSGAVAVKALRELKTKSRSKLAVGSEIVQIYCETRYGVYAEGILAEEMQGSMRCSGTYRSVSGRLPMKIDGAVP